MWMSLLKPKAHLPGERKTKLQRRLLSICIKLYICSLKKATKYTLAYVMLLGGYVLQILFWLSADS